MRAARKILQYLGTAERDPEAESPTPTNPHAIARKRPENLPKNDLAKEKVEKLGNEKESRDTAFPGSNTPETEAEVPAKLCLTNMEIIMVPMAGGDTITMYSQWKQR